MMGTTSTPCLAKRNPADALSGNRFLGGGVGERGQFIARIATCLTATPPADGILLNPSHPFVWIARLMGDEFCCSTDEGGTDRMQLFRHCFKNSRFELHELWIFFGGFRISRSEMQIFHPTRIRAIPPSSRPTLLVVDMGA